VDKTIMTQPINHVIDADSKGFFDNVSHAWLEKCLRVRIKDPSFLLLIRRFLKAGYVEAGQLVATEQGTPQGGNLRGLTRYYRYAVQLVKKWLNRRSQRRSFSWERFLAYLGHYPLPTPRIIHHLYTLSPVR
jgi:retron-type reverse transcriptase